MDVELFLNELKLFLKLTIVGNILEEEIALLKKNVKTLKI